MYKKGVAPIVSEILIVLLTIVAVAIVATSVINFVKPTLTKSTECIPYNKYFSFKDSIGGVRYNCQDGNLFGASITSKAESGENISGFKLVFVKKNGETKVATVKEVNSENIEMFGGGKIKIPKGGSTYTYVYTGEEGETFKTIEVYPILSNGRICDKADSIRIVNCDSKVNLG